MFVESGGPHFWPPTRLTSRSNKALCRTCNCAALVAELRNEPQNRHGYAPDRRESAARRL